MQHEKKSSHEMLTGALATVDSHRSMKPTGTAWLNEIPQEWELVRVGAIFEEVSLRGSSTGDVLTVSIEHGIMPQSSFEELTGRRLSKPINDKDNYRKVEMGEFVYNKMRMWQGAVGISTYNGVVSPAYVVFRAKKKANAKFLLHLMKSDVFISQSNSCSYGIVDDQNSLKFSNFKAMTLAYPPLDEQEAIANFLDRETSIIDQKIALISRKQGLLAELRKAIIHDAVTKGLDKAVCLKNSSVNWIGEIPLDWHIARIKDVAKVGAGNPAPQPSLISDDNSEMPFLRVSDLSKCVNDIAIKTRDHVAEPISFGLKIWPKGTIVFPKSGESIRTNARAMLDRNMTVVSHLACLKANAKIFNPFLFWLLKAVNFENEINQTALPALGINDIENFKIPLPPLQMQQRIVDHLDATVFRLNRIESLLRRQAELLKEQRQALIHEVVTGKMRVI